MLASRKLGACEAVVAEIEALGGHALAVVARMQQPDDVRGLVEAAARVFGQLDIIVNNAATVLDRTLETLTPDSFIGAFGTNLLGPMLLIQAAVPHLAVGGVGSVINISSVAAVRSTPTRYLYPPAKAAPVQVTRSVAVHLAPQAIRVNAIMPGAFLTDMVKKGVQRRRAHRHGSVHPARAYRRAGRDGGPGAVPRQLDVIVRDRDRAHRRRRRDGLSAQASGGP